MKHELDFPYGYGETNETFYGYDETNEIASIVNMKYEQGCFSACDEH